MRKIILLAAVGLFAALAATTSSVPASAQSADMNPNTTAFLKDLFNPYAATATPAAAPAGMKAGKRSKKKKM